VDVTVSVEHAYNFRFHVNFNSEDGGSTFHRNVLSTSKTTPCQKPEGYDLKLNNFLSQYYCHL
jgi:hypothetical protein